MILETRFTPDKYARVGERCRKLLPLTMIGDTPKLSQGTDCEPSALAPSVSASRNSCRVEKKFEDECQSLPPFVGGGSMQTLHGSSVRQGQLVH